MCWANTSEALSSVSVNEKKDCTFYSCGGILSAPTAFLATDRFENAWNWARLDSEQRTTQTVPDSHHLILPINKERPQTEEQPQRFPIAECLGCTHWVGKLRHISPRVCLSLRCPCLSHTTPPFKKKKKNFFLIFYFILEYSYEWHYSFRCTAEWFSYTYTCMYNCVIHTWKRIDILFQILFPFRLLYNTEQIIHSRILLVMYFKHSSVYMLIPTSLTIPFPHPYPLVPVSSFLVCGSVSVL